MVNNALILDFIFFSGLNLLVAQKPDEVDLLKEEIARELSKALGNIKLAERGVFVQASTLGALEALLDFLKTSKIPVSLKMIFYLFFIKNIQSSYTKYIYLIVYYILREKKILLKKIKNVVIKN